jgi:hypothetical protein
MTTEELSKKHKFGAEIKRYLVISLYLFVCFTVVMLYGKSRSPDESVELVNFGLALGKALLLGKFILIGEVIGTGTRLTLPTLVHRIAWRSVAMLFVLIIFKVLEELIIGMVHSMSFSDLLTELAEKSWLELLAPPLLMLLILIPMIAVIELSHALGAKQLKEVLGKDHR